MSNKAMKGLILILPLHYKGRHHSPLCIQTVNVHQTGLAPSCRAVI